jgi:catechol 2,3-dioxygenase-like lactoylglutathione lyase family enzyme
MNRINMLCLGVRDMEKSIRFYKALGFQTKEKNPSPPVIFFHASGGLRLELCPLELLAEDSGGGTPPESGPERFGGITLTCAARNKEEVREITELARAAGAKILREPEETSWGGFHAWFSDPDGYRWAAACSEDFTFDKSDMLV